MLLLAVLGLAAAAVCFGLLESAAQVSEPVYSLGGAFAGFFVAVVLLNRVWRDEITPAEKEAERVDSDFIYDDVVKVLDFRRSDDTGVQRVISDEHFRIRRRSQTVEPLVLNYATSGTIDSASSRTHPESYDWQEKSLAEPGGGGGRLQHCYEVRLDLSRLAVDEGVDFTSRIVYLDAFRGADGDWLETIIDYPTRRLTWVVVFPEGKRCSSAVAKEKVGRKDWQELRQRPDLLHDGTVMYWTIETPVLSTRYMVNWKWASQTARTSVPA